MLLMKLTGAWVGCRLGIIHRYAYLDYPEEIMLVWYLEL